MDTVRMREAVALIGKPHRMSSSKHREASPSIRFGTRRSLASDVVSVGALTYSFHALDISLDLMRRKKVRP